VKAKDVESKKNISHGVRVQVAFALVRTEIDKTFTVDACANDRSSIIAVIT